MQRLWPNLVSAALVFIVGCRPPEASSDANTEPALTEAVGHETAKPVSALPPPRPGEVVDPTSPLAPNRDAADSRTDKEMLFAELLEKDSRTALRWLFSLEDSAERAILLDQALPAWVGLDAQAAAVHVAGLPESDYRTLLAGELATAWAALDRQAAVSWAAGLGDLESRLEALTAILDEVAKSDPPAAGQLVLRFVGDGERAAVLERVIGTWWTIAPAAVDDWASTITDEEHRMLAKRLVEARHEADARRRAAGQ